ncbi:hypothetical protein NHX12_008211 [Muraenolepis orangiensis]|uniref:MOSC domain-containing protein n=1 Tax=Muraenolepis orangiensis TaxID=630683 RepID=A0A9Q0DL21_9TELE|nr:hypothetical protein NHX12_008211 [Muraenolepis orangiensis]
MALNIGGIAAVVVFYILILAIGVWASKRSKKEEKKCPGTMSEVTIIGGRNVNLLVGIFTMTATWVGGAYILGIAEVVYSPSQGGLFFAKPMRSQCYVTMMDPFQRRYGKHFTTALLIPAIIGDIFWVACILAALVDVPADAVFTLSLNQTQWPPWLGELKLEDAGKWLDELLLLALGGLSYQALYQRILAAASPVHAQITCYVAAGTVLTLAIPSVIIGAVAASADWNQTSYGLPSPFERGEAGKVLPLTLHYMTPPWVSVVGIGAVAAAVMSSMDSVLLSSGSMFAHNVYKSILRVKASDRECQWVIRITVLLVGLAGMGLAFSESSVFAFWIVSSDLIYCIVFSQLICVLHCPFANGYGATAGYVLSLTLRLLSGESLIHLPPVLLFPGWRLDEETGTVSQYFPFRTLIMLLSVLTIVCVSLLTRWVFTHHLLPSSWDVMGLLKLKQEEEDEEEGEGSPGDEGRPGDKGSHGGDEEDKEPSAVEEKLLAISSTTVRMWPMESPRF